MGLIAMPAGMQGHAEFSSETPPLCRYSLSRRWGKKLGDDRALLWIGHNPSEANHLWNDPSVQKICKFSHHWGYQVLHLMNIMDRIGTEPADLLEMDFVCSAGNLERIIQAAHRADKIICCWGAVHPRLAIFAKVTERALRKEGFELHTLVHNMDGSPKHPLYVKDRSPLITYKGVFHAPS